MVICYACTEGDLDKVTVQLSLYRFFFFFSLSLFFQHINMLEYKKKREETY